VAPEDWRPTAFQQSDCRVIAIKRRTEVKNADVCPAQLPWPSGTVLEHQVHGQLRQPILGIHNADNDGNGRRFTVWMPLGA
jgi:hypothetical protein